ncbi:MAG: bifunctional oligoribonuclease/PAP phosphatase NrnA, partial [Oscillospiraceae bacterium]|nr:bifunctional oligoribonuclease/PAP phosphatase NrnA [Oscillospiraceae bacterium]
DTGCFKYGNTTQLCHIITAHLMDCGIRLEQINREMFDIKSKARIKVEQHILSAMEYYLDDRCAMVAVTLDTMKKAGLAQEEFEGIAGMSVQTEGVQVGVVIK